MSEKSRYLHDHDGAEHTHGYEYLRHSHLEGATCDWVECEGFAKHNFHSTVERTPNEPHFDHSPSVSPGPPTGNESRGPLSDEPRELGLDLTKLVEEIMRKADILSTEGSLEKAEGMYDVGKYILTGEWEW